LEHLRRCYRIVGLDEAVGALREDRPGRGRVALTFDDGLYNFAGAAVPVLREFEAPATVYVVSAHITNEVPACTLLLKDVLARSTATELTDPLPELGGSCALDTDERRVDFARRASSHLITMPTASPERLDFVRRVAVALGVDIDEIRSRRTWDFLSPDEMRELAAEGYSVQVHGHEHLNVVERTPDVYQEVSTCARILGEITGLETSHYCYPFGLWVREAWPALERAGMKSATTTLYGPNSPRTPIYSLRRYMDSGNLSQLEFEFELSGLRWLLWAARNRAERWAPAEKRVTYTESGKLY
jgi:peptidoglycan/xylan/chitin deacetylase (PgdA/CDA1 family)